MRCALLSFGCLVGLLLAEVGLRLVGFGLGTDSAYQPDPHLGARLAPGFRGWHTREGKVWIEINRHGFRDRDRQIEKPQNVYRVAVLGDSFAEALQVELDETFWSVLQDQIESSLFKGMEVEVLNFGVSGYGTAQELLMLRHYVWDYDPDLVLLLFLPSNDVKNNCRALESAKGRPFFDLQGDELVLDNSFRDDPTRVRFQTSRWIQFKHALVENSRLAALVYQWKNRRGDNEESSATGEAGLAMEAFREPEDATWKTAWQITDRLLVEMANEVHGRGKRFVVAIANSGVEVHPDDAVRQATLKQLGVPDFLYPQRRVEALGAEHGFPVIGLSEPMLQYAREDDTHLHGFANTEMGKGHWNVTGHRAAANVIAERLRVIFAATPTE